MALQQAMFFDLISSMKKATARNDDSSDSDDSISHHTNRGNKLKRKAKYVQEGRLAQADGPRVYKRKLNYNGYTRNVISKSVPRVDPDGDLVEDEDNSDPELSPAEDDPYAEIKLERLLMPLTSAADLDKHPSLSIPYNSRILEDMVQEAEDMLHREEAALWRVKHLLVQFRGDDGWAPCGLFEADTDPLLLQNPQAATSAPPSVAVESSKPGTEIATWDTASEARDVPGAEHTIEATSNAARSAADRDKVAPDVSADRIISQMNHTNSRTDEESLDRPPQPGLDAQPISTLDHATAVDNPSNSDNAGEAGHLGQSLTQRSAEGSEIAPHRPQQESGSTAPEDRLTLAEDPVPSAHEAGNKASSVGGGESADAPLKGSQGLEVDANQSVEDAVMGNVQSPSRDAASDIPGPGMELSSNRDTALENGVAPSDGGDEEDGNQAHRMTTRARAQANPDSISQSGASGETNGEVLPAVHPFFIAPTETLPYRAQGLRVQLSDEVRMALSAYSQRQEEVVRQCVELLSGLRKALLMKKSVWSWCRNEAHVGEMSDGEDWIDMEEWGLEEPLKKGEEVEDEEVAVGLTKKTRNRRAAA